MLIYTILLYPKQEINFLVIGGFILTSELHLNM